MYILSRTCPWFGGVSLQIQCKKSTVHFFSQNGILHFLFYDSDEGLSSWHRSLLVEPLQQHLNLLFFVVVDVVAFNCDNVGFTQSQVTSQDLPVGDFLCDSYEIMSHERFVRISHCSPYSLLCTYLYTLNIYTKSKNLCLLLLP